MRARASDLAARAWRRACSGLGLGQPRLDEIEASVYLKYLLLQRAEDPGGPASDVLKTAALAAVLDELLGDPEYRAPLTPDALVSVRRAVAECALYRRRLGDLVRDALLSQPMTPETCLAPRAADPGTIAAMLPGHRVHAVVFSDFSLIAHELYPLCVDAFVRDSERCGRPVCNVVGVHEDWIGADGGLRRVLFVDATASPRLLECDLEEPLMPDTAQITRLEGNETARHGAVARRLLCPLVNPSAVSARADDKLQTTTALSRRGLEVPSGQCFARGETGVGLDVPSGELVVKPRVGTEGRGTAFAGPVDDDAARSAFERLVRVCWASADVPSADALVERRCDGLLYRDPHGGTLHTVALRVNVCQGPGLRPLAESGYARIGRDENSPAAGAAAVRTVPLADAWENLVRRRGDRGAPVALDEGDRARVLRAAEGAVIPFGDLLLAGVDIVLDVDDAGGIRPVVLEVNSRPAGLVHSRLLDGSDEPGVSLAFWDIVERLGAASGDDANRSRSRQALTVSV